jgi:formate dehydrogenase maturation protein FdhE
MPYLTEEEYAAKAGEMCPACGGADVVAVGGIETDGKTAWRPADCEDCGATWYDRWSLTGYSDLYTK